MYAKSTKPKHPRNYERPTPPPMFLLVAFVSLPRSAGCLLRGCMNFKLRARCMFRSTLDLIQVLGHPDIEGFCMIPYTQREAFKSSPLARKRLQLHTSTAQKFEEQLCELTPVGTSWKLCRLCLRPAGMLSEAGSR